jgi:hypothetical protein
MWTGQVCLDHHKRLPRLAPRQWEHDTSASRINQKDQYTAYLNNLLSQLHVTKGFPVTRLYNWLNGGNLKTVLPIVTTTAHCYKLQELQLWPLILWLVLSTWSKTPGSMHAADHLQRRLRERNWRRNKREREEQSRIHGRGWCNNPGRRRTWHPQDPNSMSNVMTVESPSSSMDDDNNNNDAHKTTLIPMDNRSTLSMNWTLGSSSPPPVYFAPPVNRRLLLPSQVSSLMVQTQIDVILYTDWLGCKNRALSVSVCVCMCVSLSVYVCVCLWKRTGGALLSGDDI